MREQTTCRSFQTVLAGAAAGVLATAAMTVTVRMLFPALPEEDRYELPPRMLIDSAFPEPLEAADEDLARARLALLAPVGYGAATGALYALTGERQAAGSLPRGAAYGVCVWALSYLGWILAVGLLRPATRHPADRNALMIAAHLVWGAHWLWRTQTCSGGISKSIDPGQSGHMKEK